MRSLGAVLLSVFLCLTTIAAMAHAGEGIPLDVGGGMTTGGYLGELRHDWQYGLGGNLFIQMPTKHDLEIRLLGSMQWNDGSRIARRGEDDPDFGAFENDLPETFRRTSFEAALLWRAEKMAIGNVGVPYVGAGVSTYEWVVRYVNDDGKREVEGWDQGAHALAGLRFYRTSGLFVSLEGKFHAIDTPKEWTFGYEGALLLGYLLGL